MTSTTTRSWSIAARLTLTGLGQAGTLSVSPTSVTFASGTWTGNMTVNAVDPTVTLTASNGTGATAPATPCHAIRSHGQLSVEHGRLARVPEPRLPGDRNGQGRPRLHGHRLFGDGKPERVGGHDNPCDDPQPANPHEHLHRRGLYGRIFLHAQRNLLVTDFLHYDGTKESLWTNAGVLSEPDVQQHPGILD